MSRRQVGGLAGGAPKQEGLWAGAPGPAAAQHLPALRQRLRPHRPLTSAAQHLTFSSLVSCGGPIGGRPDRSAGWPLGKVLLHLLPLSTCLLYASAFGLTGH